VMSMRISRLRVSGTTRDKIERERKRATRGEFEPYSRERDSVRIGERRTRRMLGKTTRRNKREK
jgi:hypothetical protein